MSKPLTATPPMEDHDIKRFNELIATNYRALYNSAYRLSCNATDAEDLTQETILRAYRSFSSFSGEKPFINWAMKILTRIYLDLLRNRKSRITLVSFDNLVSSDTNGECLSFEPIDSSPSPAQQLFSSVLDEQIQEVLDSLTDEQLQLLQSVAIDNMSYQELYKKSGIAIGTIRSKLHRLRRDLRQKYQHCYT